MIGQPEIASTDKSLLTRYRRGDDDAATELYLRYADRLRALATHQTASVLQQRVDAEDMVQSVFRTFFRRAASGQYDIPEGDELWKLLLVIGLNKIRYAGAFHRADKRDITKTASGDKLQFTLTTQRGGDEVALNILRLTIDEMLEPLRRSCARSFSKGLPGMRSPKFHKQLVDQSVRSNASCKSFGRSSEVLSMLIPDDLDMELDQFVERFEIAHAKNPGVDVAQFMPDVQHPRYAQIACELLRVHMELSAAAGRFISADEYRQKFPQACEQTALFKALQAEEHRVRSNSQVAQRTASTSLSINASHTNVPTGQRVEMPKAGKAYAAFDC